MFKGIGFGLLAIGCALMLPGKISKCRATHNRIDIIETIGYLMLAISGAILAVGSFV